MKKLLIGLAAAIGLAATTFAAAVDLSTVTANTTLNDGDVATGTLGSNVKISIADKATVLLYGVNINGVNDSDYSWAGITCVGDATIILAGANIVKGFYEDYPGIYVPENKTLTIRGDGSLDARSNGYAAGIGGGYEIACGNITITGGAVTATGAQAGIGGGYNAACGNITISGGTVEATSGGNAAGIGGGGGDSAACGNITISGGNVTATGNQAGIGSGNAGNCGDIVIEGGTITATGGLFAAGIGSGVAGNCGDITITKGVTSVTATKGENAPNSIGAGDDGTCGTVTIGGVEGAITESPYIYAPGAEVPIIDLSSLTADTTLNDGDVATGTLGSNVKISIADKATVLLYGVTIEGENNYLYPWAGITCEGDATIILAGANTVKGFNPYYPGVYVPENTTLTIRGDGSLDARSNGYAAGIGGGWEISCGNIVINGGTIAATGGNQAAGIGGGNLGKCGDITITGGDVTATGGNLAAGIGSSGNQGSCGDITITGGDVTATGNEAGIGGGYEATCGNITISGGSVSATSDSTGAGIGGGSSGNCGTITISGGTVEATADFMAAGIGSGNLGKCGDITITGGDVTATGGDQAAGIGGGAEGECGNITITKGVTSVTATKGTSAPNSVGAGYYAGTCGTVTIGGVVGAITESPYIYAPGAEVPIIDLSSLTANTTLNDGDVATGTLGSNVKISIADKATVTLRDVTINGDPDYDYLWAGITCEGNATIILEGANSVTGFYGDYPGVYVPSGRTLTIKGDGSLDARSNGYAAGIGGGWNMDCGDIVIKGGTITAIGGLKSAGIGGGCNIGGYNADCGDIVIEGGTIIATGGNNAAGIGGGYNAACGDITITEDVTSVTATKGGADAPNSIGAGLYGTCGTVTIGGVEGAKTASPYAYPENVVNLSALTGPYEAKEGDVLIGSTTYDVTVPGGVTVTINGVDITGAGGGSAEAPEFAAGGKAATTEFVKGEGGKWTLTTFAELANDAVGADVEENQIKVYAADTVEGLETATPMTSGVELKEKKSAVMTTIEVTPSGSPDSQFFKVTFGE